MQLRSEGPHILGLTVSNGRNISTDLPRAGLNGDIVTGLLRNLSLEEPEVSGNEEEAVLQ